MWDFLGKWLSRVLRGGWAKEKAFCVANSSARVGFVGE